MSWVYWGTKQNCWGPFKSDLTYIKDKKTGNVLKSVLGGWEEVDYDPQDKLRQLWISFDGIPLNE